MAANRKITPHFIEVGLSTLGFISNCLDFTKAVKITAMPDTVKYKIVASAVKSSFELFRHAGVHSTRSGKIDTGFSSYIAIKHCCLERSLRLDFTPVSVLDC